VAGRSNARRRSPAGQPDLTELGTSGLKRFGGRIYEEFLKELQGPPGIKVITEMSSNDPIVGAILFAIKMQLRSVTWRVEPASQNGEDVRAADHLDSCMGDMSSTWADFVTEALSMAPYGWAYHELCYKRRSGPKPPPTTPILPDGGSDPQIDQAALAAADDPDQTPPASKFSDGLIGWRKIPLRGQETLLRWEFDASGGIQGMHQLGPPDYRPRFVPIDKALLFRTESTKNNPEGRSALRTAYRPWFFKRRIEEHEAIGIERELAGYPVLQPPEGLDIWNANDPDMVALRAEAEAMVRGVRRDEMEGALLPFGWTFSLITSGGARAIDVGQTIDRKNREIALSVLADFILIGHEKVGSFALAATKKDMFGTACSAWMDALAEILNDYAIPRLFELNPFRVTELPTLAHGDVTDIPLDEIGGFVKDMTGVGVLTPDDNLEAHIRQIARLPEKTEPTSADEMRTATRRATEPDTPPESGESDERIDAGGAPEGGSGGGASQG
jgi:hypothetical protein